LQTGGSSFRQRKLRVQQNYDEEQDNETNVHLCWVLVWISTISYQDDIEKQFRLKQLVEVIRRVNAKNVKLNVSTAFAGILLILVGNI